MTNFYILASSAGTIATWFRHLLFSINESIYRFMGTVYAFVLDLAAQSNIIILNTNLGDVMSKIYVFIGVIMLFRLGISILQFIANPDKVMDKKDGWGHNIIPRVITVLVLIVFMPTFFTWLYDLQNRLFKSDLITSFFSVNESGADYDSGDDNNASSQDRLDDATDNYNDVARDNETAQKTKADLEEEKVKLCEAANLEWMRYSDAGTSTQEEYEAAKKLCDDATAAYNAAASDAEETSEALSSAKISLDTATNNYNTAAKGAGNKFADTIMMSFISINYAGRNKDDKIENEAAAQAMSMYNEQMTKLKDFSGENYDINDVKKSVDYGAVDGYLSAVYQVNGKDYYVVEYSGLISLVAALVALVMLIATAFKAAVRIFKLIIYEIIAPIPIIMYLDPANMKKGESSLEKWFKGVITTYADLFIRIIMVGFVAFIIGQMGGYMAASGESIMLKLFIIFGALLFMNTAPEMIFDLFGIKTDPGGFNPLKQLSDINQSPILKGAGLGVAAGAVGGAARGLVQGGGLKGKALGALSGAALGAKTGVGAKGGLTGAYGAGRDMMANSMQRGPDAAGDFATRALQRGAAGAIRSSAKTAEDNLNSFAQSTPFTSAKRSYDTASTGLATAKSSLSSLEGRRNEYSSQIAAFRAQGNHAEASRVGANLQHLNDVLIPTAQANVGTAQTTYDTARVDYNTQVREYNTRYDSYQEEVSKVNVKTGQDMIKYSPDKGDSRYERMKEIQ